MARKDVIRAVSGFLVVAVVIGVVARVMLSQNDTPSEDKDEIMSSTSKYASALCEPTQYRQTCERTLSKASSSASPNEFIQIAINATKEAIQARFNVPDEIKEELPKLAPNLPERNISMLRSALTDCKN